MLGPGSGPCPPLDSMRKLTPRRILRGIWNRTGRRFIRRVEFDIMRRSLELPNLRVPRRSAMDVHGESDETFSMWPCTHEIVDKLGKDFPPAKLAHFHQMVDHPDVDFVIRTNPDESVCWGYMMHAVRPFEDPKYRFTIPLQPDEAFQFDGWVHPEHRGRLIAIVGTNWAFDRRRTAGTKAVVVTVRKNDRPAQMYHRRYEFEKIGEVIHWRVGPLRFNKVILDRPADAAQA
mgnify:FL=1